MIVGVSLRLLYLIFLLDKTSTQAPVIAVLNEGRLVALSGEWKAHGILPPDCSPAEVDARLRLARSRSGALTRPDGTLVIGALTIEQDTYSAQLPDRHLDLTYKEFELLTCVPRNSACLESLAA